MFIQHCVMCRPSDSTVSEDAGIESRIVATLALVTSDALTTGLDLIHHLESSHPNSRLDFIHYSARSHPTLG
jgi:hypothetical protein